MRTATKIRLYPNTAERDSLARQFGCVRFVRNKALAMKKAAWTERKQNLSCYTLKSMLPVWKAGEFHWLKEADSQALQSAILNLDVAYRNFFEHRSGFPRFLKKHDARQSIQYPQRVKIDGDRIYLPKVGRVKAVVHREIAGKIKTVTVSRESNGKYYAAILTEDGLPAVAPIGHIDAERITGIDLGLKDAIADSRGHKSGNPKFLKTALPNLRRKQKALSRKIEAAKQRFEAAKAAWACTMLRTVMKDILEWRAQDIFIPVSVNIFASNLQDENFPIQVKEVLNEYPDIPPEMIEFEIVESSHIGDFISASKVLMECQAMGIQFSIDDFGTGFSSLAYLRKLPVQSLKIDQSFVRDMLSDHDDLVIVSAVINLAKAFNYKVIAEGVETADIGQKLIDIGCRYAQGYAISKPIAAERVSGWIREWEAKPTWLGLGA